MKLVVVTEVDVVVDVVVGSMQQQILVLHDILPVHSPIMSSPGAHSPSPNSPSQYPPEYPKSQSQPQLKVVDVVELVDVDNNVIDVDVVVK